MAMTTMRASRDGILVEVKALAGQPVSAGDLLFTVRSESLGDRTSELQTLIASRDGAREALGGEIVEIRPLGGRR